MQKDLKVIERDISIDSQNQQSEDWTGSYECVLTVAKNLAAANWLRGCGYNRDSDLDLIQVER